MENTSDTKRKSGMELEVKDGALLWQSIEIDERDVYKRQVLYMSIDVINALHNWLGKYG